jgi:hypothetical protein
VNGVSNLGLEKNECGNHRDQRGSSIGVGDSNPGVQDSSSRTRKGDIWQHCGETDGAGGSGRLASLQVRLVESESERNRPGSLIVMEGMITRRHLRNKRVIGDNGEGGEMMDEEATQLEGAIMSQSGGDSGEETSMQCGQPTEDETGGSSESRGEHLTSPDKNSKDNPIDMQSIMSYMKEMFREIRENRKESEKIREENRKDSEKIREELRKESEKIANEFNGRLESILVVHKREMLSSMNQIASDVELRADRKIGVMNKEISQIAESTDVKFRVLTEKVHNDKIEINNNFEILRQEVIASHAQVAKQSESRCERVSQYEKRMAEVELVSEHISKQYGELRTQVELLRNQKLVESKSNTGEVQYMRSNHRQSDSRIENTLSSSDVITHISEPLSTGVPHNDVDEETTEGQTSSPHNDASNQEKVRRGNPGEFVRGILSYPLDLALPTFENKPDQNAQAHLNSLSEYLEIRNIPPPLQLAVARQSLKGISVMTWAEANWDQMKTFEGFRKAFLEKFWSPSCQARVRLQIYQERYDPRGTANYCDHLMKYAVKAKYLEPPMSNLEFLNALKEHYPLGVKKAWIVVKPQTLQEAAACLSDVADLENDQVDLEPRRPAHYNLRNSPQPPRRDPHNEDRGGRSRETMWNDPRYHGRPDAMHDPRYYYQNRDRRTHSDQRGNQRHQMPDSNRDRREAGASNDATVAADWTRNNQERPAGNRD